jgi:hypothetical protein
VQHSEKADWIKREEKEKIDSMNWMPIKTTETTSFLSKTHNWKSAGSNQIPNYWLKAFLVTHSYIIKFINTIIEEPKQMPDWLTTGITYLLPKSEVTNELKNYRSITCLSTMHKTLTGIIAKRISVHLKEHNLLPAEQKGCHSGSKGCKDQMLISKSNIGGLQEEKKELKLGVD